MFELLELIGRGMGYITVGLLCISIPAMFCFMIWAIKNNLYNK